MRRSLKTLVAAGLAAHGLIHLIGVLVYALRADLADLPYTTTLLDGRWDIGPVAMTAYGIAWLIPAAGFLMAGLLLATDRGLTVPVLWLSVLVSLGLSVLNWHATFAGGVVDLFILSSLFTLTSARRSRPPSHTPTGKRGRGHHSAGV